MKTIPSLIGGRWIGPENRSQFDNFNPALGVPYAKVVKNSIEDVDEAVQCAKKALHGPWGQMSLGDRVALLEKVADTIMERFDAFLAAEMADTGKPISLASQIDIPRGAANFRIFARMAASMGSDSFFTHTPDGQGAVNYVQQMPVGVVGVICPWNLPLLLMTWKVAPALAMGNTVIVKPSEETPATATLLGEVMEQVGVPAGVYNVVHGFGPECVGDALVTHPDVAAITFTGESRTGSAIMARAAAHIKPLSFELGGKNPAVVFGDADFDKALEGTTRSVFSNCGQVCLCSERVYVHESIFDRFAEALTEKARGLVLADPQLETTSMGPLISQVHRDKVQSYFDLVKQEGGTFLTGGVTAQPQGFENGFWVEPTIATGLSETARVQKEEIFGPFCHLTPFKEEEEVIHMANDTEYGLAAAIWTEDLKRAHRVAQSVEAGMVWVNTWFLRDLRTPFGGVKNSGIGREGGRHSLEFYSESKTICIKM
ncbi:MAG: 2-hydroxymuconic semialdehyde dehydrogenase [Myxococcales bacterium]|nr:2-hydroxymuconic semialdehyde dehydrogenase [Myxococcales bacterium]|tara:strand:+ start:5312 stop:6769 length:1458 start_codon:yes stop_codon:yes gene_type:complete